MVKCETFLSKSTPFSHLLILTHSQALEHLLNFYEIDQPSKISGKITKNKLIYKVVVGSCTGQIRVTTISNKMMEIKSKACCNFDTFFHSL